MLSGTKQVDFFLTTSEQTVFNKPELVQDIFQCYIINPN